MAWFESHLNGGGGGTKVPILLSASSANKSSLSTLTYTFTEDGTFQYYVFENSDITPIAFNVSIQLNGNTITPTVDTPSGGNYSFGYGEIAVHANDVLTVSNTITESHRCIQLFVFKDADISVYELIGFRGNDGTSFSMDYPGYLMLEPNRCSYWGIRNTFNYTTVIGYTGLYSIPTPNDSPYYYGLTYAIRIG